jgi:hypothetical protein
VAILGPDMKVNKDTIELACTCIWRSIVVPLTFISALIWDTLTFFSSPVSAVEQKSAVYRATQRKCTRRIKRIRPYHQAMFFFPDGWLILTGSVSELASARNGAQEHPFHRASASIAGTFQRIAHLHSMVDLSPSVFVQFHKIKAK